MSETPPAIWTTGTRRSHDDFHDDNGSRLRSHDDFNDDNGSHKPTNGSHGRRDNNQDTSLAGLSDCTDTSIQHTYTDHATNIKRRHTECNEQIGYETITGNSSLRPSGSQSSGATVQTGSQSAIRPTLIGRAATTTAFSAIQLDWGQWQREPVSDSCISGHALWLVRVRTANANRRG